MAIGRILVVSHNQVTEGKEEEFKRLAKQLEQITREKDAGCIKYELVQDQKSPLHFVFVEEWASQRALEAHMNAAHFQETVPKLNQLRESGDLFVLEPVQE